MERHLQQPLSGCAEQDDRRALLQCVFLDTLAWTTSYVPQTSERADNVSIGPGHLYTSVIPYLLIDDICDATRVSEGRIIYSCNVMTKHGETDNYQASAFVAAIHHYLGQRVATVIVNTEPYPEEQAARYAAQQAYPVEADLEAVRRLVPRVLTGRFYAAEKMIRHDAERVALAIWPEIA